jgi:hypothetical protein
MKLFKSGAWDTITPSPQHLILVSHHRRPKIVIPPQLSLQPSTKPNLGRRHERVSEIHRHVNHSPLLPSRWEEKHSRNRVCLVGATLSHEREMEAVLGYHRWKTGNQRNRKLRWGWPWVVVGDVADAGDWPEVVWPARSPLSLSLLFLVVC